ncbi:MAG: hypothetical protein GY710_27255 [Desulfobacteraceae bacterium]|nr:hypothetical protein [Desulfobacteraceae bacterium]
MKAKMTGPFHSGQHTFAAQVGSRHIPSSIAGPHSLETLLDNYEFGEEITVILLPKESDSFSKFGMSRLQLLQLRIDEAGDAAKDRRRKAGADAKEKSRQGVAIGLKKLRSLAKISPTDANKTFIGEVSCIITDYYWMDIPGSALRSVVSSLLRI